MTIRERDRDSTRGDPQTPGEGETSGEQAWKLDPNCTNMGIGF